MLASCANDEPATTLLEGQPAGPYRLTLALTPPVPMPARDTTLSFALTHAGNGAAVDDLQVVHERLLHTFIVSRDFSSFAHLHHEDFQSPSAADVAAGTLHFPYRFPHLGRFRIVSEFTRDDRNWTKHFDVVVGETARPEAPRLNLARSRQVGPYTARLHVSPDTVVAGHEVELVLELTRNGAAVTDLELYLGSEVHVAIWRSDGEQFGHTHSYTPQMAAMMKAMREHTGHAGDMAAMMRAMLATPAELVYHGPRVPVRYVFPTAGVYVLFMQCAPAGSTRVFAFMLEVGTYRDGMDTRIESIVPAAG